jgi:predicted HicB family RNase H-like nuclease
MEQPKDVLNVRIDRELHKQLVAEAKRRIRSLTGEVEFRLRESIKRESEATESAA